MHPDVDLIPRLARALRTWLILGVVAVLLVPFARTNTTWLGFLPMWLVAMPASALWALNRFALPKPATAAATAIRRRRRAPQARRRSGRGTVVRGLRAA
jgi:hypothetical protein